MLLDAAGERVTKRPSPFDDNSSNELAKRVKGIGLNGK